MSVILNKTRGINSSVERTEEKWRTRNDFTSFLLVLFVCLFFLFSLFCLVIYVNLARFLPAKELRWV